MFAKLALAEGKNMGSSNTRVDNEVQIDSGKIRGVGTGDVISFKGIPYAAPPVGDLRWRMPQPVQPWSDVLVADEFGPASMQTEDVPKSEDCLTLNVWRPAETCDQPLPVMVWIHGGAMVCGSAALYPLDGLASQGVVAVSMNFRLGRLGHFAHPALAAESPNDVRGNYGYMDQRAALQWVQRNIAVFGGDPNRVTIFGESSGGGSVIAHLTSPLSRDLFQQGIVQSAGSPSARAKAVVPSTDLADAERMAVEWASSLGITGEGADALRALRSLPVETIIEGVSAYETLAALSAGAPPAGMAMSIIDGQFLVDSPEAVLANRQQAMVPTIVGATDRDLAMGIANSKEELFAQFGPDADQARQLYDPRGYQTLEELKQQVFADKLLVEPARHFANEMARAGQPVWSYRYAYVFEGLRNLQTAETIEQSLGLGSKHTLEIPFTNNATEMLEAGFMGSPKIKVTPTDRMMADLTSGYWVQFAKTGNPNGEGRPTWPQHDPAADRIMHFTNSGVIVGTDPLKQRLDLWEAVWERNR
ncbi:carboxylesterase [Limnoraphis robusta CS-951]|uniref:Carboxylic ester hydrolase n=1 Tax=Limnoraphis robusta CS-951 TaxID=1637645 RepID=A0A0F5YGG3_9CYAN|nr:carboxylesterase [Limnoraphis robusta CS-951]